MIYGFELKLLHLILKYSNHRKAIIDHVDPEDKSLLNEINIGGNESLPLTWNTKTLFILMNLDYIVSY